MKDIQFRNFLPINDDRTIKEPFYTHLELFEFALHFYKQSGYRMDVAISSVLNFVYHGSSRMKVNDPDDHREVLSKLDDLGLSDLRSTEIEHDGFETYYGQLLDSKYGYNVSIEISRIIMLLDQCCENIKSKDGISDIQFIDKEKAEIISPIRTFVDDYLSLSLVYIFRKAILLNDNKINTPFLSKNIHSRNLMIEKLYVYIIHSLAKDDVINTILATAKSNSDCLLSLKNGNITQEIIQKVACVISLIVQSFVYGEVNFDLFERYVKYTDKSKYETYRILPQIFFPRNSSQAEFLSFIGTVNDHANFISAFRKYKLMCLGGIQKVEERIKTKNSAVKKIEKKDQYIFYETSGVVMYNDSGSIYNSLLSGTEVISPVWIEKSKDEYSRVFGIGEYSYKRIRQETLSYSYNAYNISRTILKFTAGQNVYRSESVAIDDRNFIMNTYDTKGGVDVSKWDAALKVNPAIDIAPEILIFTCGFSRHRVISTDASPPLKRGGTENGNFVIMPTIDEFECPKVKGLFQNYKDNDRYFFPIYNVIRLELFMEYIHAHRTFLQTQNISGSFRERLKKHIDLDVADFIIDNNINIFEEVDSDDRQYGE